MPAPPSSRRAAPAVARLLVIALATAALPPGGCTDSSPPPAPTGRTGVYVSIPPQAYIVERVGGQRVDVGVLIGAGQSPHTFEPTPRQMAAISRARVYFSIGAPFERRILQRLAETSPGVNVVDTGAGVPRRMMEAALPIGDAADRGEVDQQSHDERGGERAAHDDEHAVGAQAAHDEHAAGEQLAHDDHAHAVGEPDPHIWLAPVLVKIQARHIRDALTRASPEHAGEFDDNLRRFEADLDALDAEIAALLAPYRGRAVLVFHPAYGYFTDAYGLRQVAVEAEGKSPGPRQLAELVAAARARRARVIFIQPQISAQKAETVAQEIGARVVPIDPLERDYMNNLRHMAQAIAATLAEEGP
jgi:zinc transport system substrate-binding protein